MSNRSIRRKFGQNYLKDPVTILKIENAINLKRGDNCLEIGPGRGSLTDFIINSEANVIAIDIDRNNIAHLKKKYSKHQVDLICGDVLKFDYSKLPKRLRVIGNLPYNISTQIIFNLISAANRIEDIHCMLQKEVAERICASPGERNWGRLAIKTSLYFSSQILFNIEPNAFDIQPKVTSSFIRMTRLNKPLLKESDYANFSKFIDQCFVHKRKNIRNNLQGHIKDWSITQMTGNEKPEKISLDNFISLFKMLRQ